MSIWVDFRAKMAEISRFLQCPIFHTTFFGLLWPGKSRFFLGGGGGEAAIKTDKYINGEDYNACQKAVFARQKVCCEWKLGLFRFTLTLVKHT